MADVADKIISANDVRRGTVTCSISGKAFVKNTEKTEANHNGGTPSELETKLSDRFDNPTYYTA